MVYMKKILQKKYISSVITNIGLIFPETFPETES